jgi:hypothetical protein
MRPKVFVILSAVFLFTTATKNSFAQVQVEAAQHVAINQQLVTMRAMSGMRYDASSSVFLPRTYVVTMTDGSKLEVYSKIYLDTVLHKNYLVFVDKNLKRSDPNRIKKIYPSQTRSIARNLLLEDDQVVRKKFDSPLPVYFTGFAAGSCWLFKIIEGPINVYSFFSEKMGTYFFAPESIIALQSGDGDMVNITEDNIKMMVGQDINALMAIQKKDYLGAIQKYNRDTEKDAKK